MLRKKNILIGQAFLILLLCACASHENGNAISIDQKDLPQNPDMALNTSTEYKAKITDKSGEVYFITQIDYLNHGYWNENLRWETQAQQQATDAKYDKSQYIFSTIGNPESGGCYKGEYKDFVMKEHSLSTDELKYGFVKFSNKIKENQNKQLSYVTTVEEEICATGKHRIRYFVITPQEHGLKIESSISKDLDAKTH